MFHIENVQKIYRGGAIVVFSLLVIAAIIGIYNNKNEKIKKIAVYSIIASISLPFFYYLKEDSIWIMPFVLGATFLAIIYIIKNKVDKKIKRILLVVLPIITLVAVKYAYCGINYLYYNEFAITDRTGTYFKEVMADIIKIDEKDEKDNIWITKKMMYKAVDSSKTLQSIRPYIDDMYENSFALVDGEFEGDMIFWTIKEAVGEAGIYAKGGKELNRFYKDIDKELDEAFKKNKLKEDTDKKIYISSIAKGFTVDELIEYYSKTTPEAIKMLITYSENETTVHNAYGNYEDIVFMDTLTNSTTVWPNEMTNFYKPHTLITKISEAIVSLYQKTGYIIAILSLIGGLIFTFKIIKDIIKKKYEELDLFLIMLGILVDIAALLFGVEWFTSWCGGSIYRHIYNYTCGLIPLIQILEITGIYFLFREIKQFMNNKRRSNKYEKRSK